MATNKKILSLLCIALGLGVSSCAHESKVQPSKGHIDGQSIPNNPVASTSASDATTANVIPKPVSSSTYLPPPKPKAKEPVYSIVVYDTPVKEVLFAIARDSKLNVDIHPSIQGRVTLNAVDQTLPAILERLSKQVDLTYKVQGNVLTIAPDQPVLRTYKVDYVNMSRDASGFIGADGQISSTGQSSGSGGTTSSTSGTGANNSSRTTVSSKSENHFWKTLEKNISDLLAETDKEIIISRIDADKTSANTGIQGKSASANAQNNSANTNGQVDSQKALTEYKTLFAANVISNPEAGIISVRGTNKQHERVQEFLDKVLTSAKRQVLIEATIVEVRLSDNFQSGIDWSRLNNSASNSGFIFRQQLGPQVNVGPTGALTTTANALGSVAANGGFIAGYVNPLSRIGSIAASINLLEQFGDTKVLSSPKLMVLNNQTAVLKVVDNLVYFTVQSQQSQGSVGGGILSTVTTTPNIVPVGVVMSVTPQINDLSNVNINVRPTVSRVLGYKRDPNPNLINIESLVPEIQVREMESMLQINSGKIAVLGGLMQDEISNNSDRVPGLSKVPVIGKAFTSKNDATRKTELVIFLRPTVITNASLESDELASYKQYLPSQQLENTLDADGER
ncbi:MAG: pilus (MSHA type) biogenesis protein MshL [Methylotenera sp.]|nr:pilus (MSHA type) biogenesis protein MshL [Methylotenera sp.]MDD4925245.1 pilus (MSHA type) biogenesis protein MshL [Methylotenera sp.]